MPDLTDRERLLRLARRRSGLTTRDVVGAGIHRQVLSRLVREGVLQRVARVQYRLTMVHPQHNEQPWTDEIVAEVRSAREQLFAACDYDLEKLADRLRRAQKVSGRAVVTFPRRMPAQEVSA